MLGLPKNTEVLKQLPKKQIYSKFSLANADKVKFDNDISKLFIVHELSTRTINVSVGAKVSSIYLISIELKNKDFSEKNISLIAKLIPQNIIFLLRYEEQALLAVYYTGRLIKSEWENFEDLSLNIDGLNFDSVFENFIKQIGNITVEEGETLATQLELNDSRRKIEKDIERLSKKIASEKQPHKKFKLMEELGKLKRSRR